MNFSQNRPKVYFKTFGCRTNVFDTQVMMSNLKILKLLKMKRG